MNTLTRNLAILGIAAGCAAAATPASAESLREFGRGPMAAQSGVMTQSQARRACINDIRGKSRRAVPRATLEICMRQKMFGR